MALTCVALGLRAAVAAPHKGTSSPSTILTPGACDKVQLDSNGKVDTVSYMDGARVFRIGIDKDEDGKIERWESYD